MTFKLTRLAVFLFALALFSTGCAAKEAAPSSATSAPPAASVAVSAGAPLGGEGAPLNANRALVVTMHVALTVERVADAESRVRAAVERSGGFVADSQTSGGEDSQTARLELKIPADKARGVRTAFADLGEVTSSSEKVEDVTEQQADLEARLRNARVQEKRILEILSGKASSIAELVEAEKELSRIRENIERLEAQDRVTKSRVALATIHLTLSTKTVAAWKTPGASLARAARIGVDGAAAFAVYSGIAFVTIAPTVLPIALLVFGVVVLVRRRLRARAPSFAG